MTRVLTYKKDLVAMLGETENANILDYGCGSGDFIELLLSGQEKRGRKKPHLIYAVDSNPKMLDAIQFKFKDEFAAGIVACERCDSPKDLSTTIIFDKIICQNVLECLENKVEFIDSFQSFLASDGIFILSHHDFDSALFNSAYKQLTRELIHCFSDTKQSWQEHCDGQMGRKIPGLINQSVFRDASCVKTMRITETELIPGNYGYLMVQMLLSTAKEHFKEEDILLWRQDLEEKSETGTYYFAIDMVVAVLNGGENDS